MGKDDDKPLDRAGAIQLLQRFVPSDELKRALVALEQSNPKQPEEKQDEREGEAEEG